MCVCHSFTRLSTSFKAFLPSYSISICLLFKEAKQNYVFGSRELLAIKLALKLSLEFWSPVSNNHLCFYHQVLSRVRKLQGRWFLQTHHSSENSNATPEPIIISSMKRIINFQLTDLQNTPQNNQSD